MGLLPDEHNNEDDENDARDGLREDLDDEEDDESFKKLPAYQPPAKFGVPKPGNPPITKPQQPSHLTPKPQANKPVNFPTPTSAAKDGRQQPIGSKTPNANGTQETLTPGDEDQELPGEGRKKATQNVNGKQVYVH